MTADENLVSLKAFDNDKYLALMFAPADKKAQLAALFNFHYLISQIPLEVSEAMIGMIKFQWWRDVLEEMTSGKPPRPHPVLLGFKHSNINLGRLGVVIDSYEKLLDSWQPRTLDELEGFIEQTQMIIFEQAANVLETTYSTNHAKAYCYTYMARKLKGKQDELSAKLLAQSRELAVGGNAVFDVITRYYNNNPAAPRWRLLLKLAFSRAAIL